MADKDATSPLAHKVLNATGDAEADMVTLTVTEARALDFTCEAPDSSAADDLSEALDRVQGDVFTGESREAFLIIRIVPAP